jgi:hypothetical protein
MPVATIGSPQTVALGAAESLLISCSAPSAVASVAGSTGFVGAPYELGRVVGEQRRQFGPYGRAVTLIVESLAGSITVEKEAPSLPGGGVVSGTETPVAPGAPTVQAGPGIIDVYGPPSANATSYTATASPGGATATGAFFPLRISGLTNGVAYTVTLVGNNADGQSAASAPSRSVTPTAGRPSHLASLPVAVWLDASQITGIANGAVVPSWPDSSGNGFAFAQATTAQQPVFTSSWLSTGRPAVTFDGINDNLVSALTSAELGGIVTVFAVFSLTALTGVGGHRDQRILTGETRRYDRGFALSTGDTSLGGGGNSRVAIRGATSEINSASAFGNLSIDTPYIVSLIVGKQFFVNGARQLPLYGGLPAWAPRNQGLAIGNIPNAAEDQSLRGPIAELIICRGQITDPQRHAVEAALATKYGMTAPTADASI